MAISGGYPPLSGVFTENRLWFIGVAHWAVEQTFGAFDFNNPTTATICTFVLYADYLATVTRVFIVCDGVHVLAVLPDLDEHSGCYPALY